MPLALMPLLFFLVDPKAVPPPVRFEFTALGTNIPAGLYRGSFAHAPGPKAAAGAVSFDALAQASYRRFVAARSPIDLRVWRDRRVEINGIPVTAGADLPLWGRVYSVDWAPHVCTIVLVLDDGPPGAAVRWESLLYIMWDGRMLSFAGLLEATATGHDISINAPLTLVEYERLR